jgi:ketosteroid isomerase-like protein
MRYILVIFLAFASVTHSAYAQHQTLAQATTPSADSGSPDVQKAVDAFIEAFNNLDWERFRLGFTDDATVFFPFPQVPRRANGRAEVEAVFKRFFDEGRKRKSGPPYLNIEPKDVKIQRLKDAAIVTFHLEGADAVGRRTVVFQKQGDKWLIAHLSASSMAKPK